MDRGELARFMENWPNGMMNVGIKMVPQPSIAAPWCLYKQCVQLPTPLHASTSKTLHRLFGVHAQPSAHNRAPTELVA